MRKVLRAFLAAVVGLGLRLWEELEEEPMARKADLRKDLAFAEVAWVAGQVHWQRYRLR